MIQFENASNQTIKLTVNTLDKQAFRSVHKVSDKPGVAEHSNRQNDSLSDFYIEFLEEHLAGMA